MADRKLIVTIVGDDSSLHRAFGRSSKDAQTWSKGIERAARGGIVATVGFRGLGRSVAFASGAFLGGAGFIAAARSSISAASDLNEQLNKTNVLFGDSADTVKAWARSTANSFGISQRAALEAAGGFGSMLETAGLTSGEAAKFSRRLVELAADMASFNNIDPTDALDKLRSGLAGEAEPLRRLGVLLSETRVQQQAYASGIAKAGTQLTEQQKVLARYQLILKDTARQQGDFARTSGGLANQQRILSAQVQNLQAALGQALLPDVLRVVKALNQWLSSSENQAKVQNTVTNAVKTGERVIQGFLDVMRPLAAAAQSLAGAMGGTRNAIRLLIAVMVASKVVAFASSLTGLGTSAATATGRVNGLRAALLRLGAVTLVTVAIEVLINKDKIQRSVDDFLRRNRLSFLAGQKIEIPADIKLPDLRRTRDQIAAVKGEGDLLVKALDKVLEHFREVDRQRLHEAERGVVRLRRQLDGIKGKEVEVSVVQRGITQVERQVAGIKGKSVEVRIIQRGIRELQRELDGVRGKKVPVDFFETGLREIAQRLNALRAKRIAIRVTSTGLDDIQKQLAEVGDKGINISLALKNLRDVQHDLAGIKDKTVTIQVLEQGVRDLQAKLRGVRGKDVQVKVLEQGIADLRSKLEAVTRDRTVKVHVEVDPAQNIAAAIVAPLAAARALAERTLAQAKLAAGRSRRGFDRGADRRALQLDQAETEGAQAELREIARQEEIVKEQIRVQGHTVALDRQLFELERRRTQVQKDLADQRQATAEAAQSAAQARFQAKIAALETKIDRLDARGQLRREIAALNAEERAVRAEIRAEGSTADLEQQLLSIEQKRAEIRKRIAEAKRERRQGRQFQALGLTAEGEQPLASTQTLLKRVGNLRQLIKGTVLDTPKTRAELDRIAKVLAGKFGKVGRQVRAAIIQMLNDIAGALKQGGDKLGPLTKTKGLNTNQITRGLGLTPEQRRELRGRLSSFNSEGRALAGSQTATTGAARFTPDRPIHVDLHAELVVDGQKMAAVVRRAEQKFRRRNPQQKRGPNRIGGV